MSAFTENRPPHIAAPARSRLEDTETWYKKYYQERGHARNDLYRNPEVFFQKAATDRCLVSALRRAHLEDVGKTTVLDVGCGAGSSVLSFLALGFDPTNITGVDIQPERIAKARSRFPNVVWILGDATQLELATGSFDIVTESTMFVQLTDPLVAEKIAAEMIRVCRPGGHVVLIDWRYSKPRHSEYKGLSRQRVERLFRVGELTELLAIQPGALIPPVGRFLSRRLPSLYFVVSALLPFAVGLTATVLRKS